MERCNPCVVSLAGWPSGFIRARLWAKGEWHMQSVVYPARETVNMSSGELQPEPLPPFGPNACADCGLPVASPRYPNCSLVRASAHAVQRRLPHVVRWWWAWPSPLCFGSEGYEKGRERAQRAGSGCQGDCGDVWAESGRRS